MLQTGGQWGRYSFVPRVFGFARGTIVGTAVDALTQSKFFPLNNWQNQATEMAFVHQTRILLNAVWSLNDDTKLLWDGCLPKKGTPKCNVFVYNLSLFHILCIFNISFPARMSKMTDGPSPVPGQTKIQIRIQNDPNIFESKLQGA